MKIFHVVVQTFSLKKPSGVWQINCKTEITGYPYTPELWTAYMERNFMISIQFEGRTVYANVFEYRHSPAVYHVHFIDHVVPNQLKLYEQEGEIVPAATDHANPELVKQVVVAIRNNPNRI